MTDDGINLLIIPKSDFMVDFLAKI
jgi:hypothetical protein